ncbi:hypothetical protein [Arthrobacter wenxiniae]|uniref:hypothetical protein n=1 Tax=Arthrobacter wenxiniae TaxID=2713570 RepID=UPI003CCDCDE4
MAIGRAIVGQRRLILADESTGALDAATGDGNLEVLGGRAETGTFELVGTVRDAGVADGNAVPYLKRDQIPASMAASLSPPEAWSSIRRRWPRGRCGTMTATRWPSPSTMRTTGR